MRTVRYTDVAVKTQIPGGHARLPAVCTWPADSGHRLVHSSVTLAVTPVGAAVDTVKRNAHRAQAAAARAAVRPSLAGFRRDHLRKRRAKQPWVPVECPAAGDM